MKTHAIILGLLLAPHAFAAENAVTNRPSISTDHLSFYTNYVSIYTNHVSIYTNETILANRLTLSARFGFNVRAKFGPRLTPDGLGYNYLDGYVLDDATENAGGMTQNWGYDNSARQDNPAARTISMTRLSSGADPVSDKFDDDASPGAELVYARRLLVRDQWHFGVEAAANFTSIGMSESATTSGSGFQDVYPYLLGPAPTSPRPDGSPYQQPFGVDPGGSYFLISRNPTAASPIPVNNILVDEHRKFDADLWGFRLGPYVERQLSPRWAVNLAGGLAVAIVDGDASWSQTLTVGGGVPDSTYSGRTKDSDVLWGWYVGGNVTWQIDRRWDMTGGVQYQDVGIYRQNAGARQAELDLSKSIFVTIGVSWRF